MKKFNLIKCGLLLLLGILFCTPATAQDQEWTLIQEQDGVKIYRSYTICEEKPYVLLKIENLNDNEVTVNWNSKFVMMGKDVLTEDNRIFTVKPQASVIGDCQNSSAKINPYEYVSIFKPGVSDYFISNLKVN